jgi:hypothetical protein
MPADTEPVSRLTRNEEQLTPLWLSRGLVLADHPIPEKNLRTWPAPCVASDVATHVTALRPQRLAITRSGGYATFAGLRFAIVGGAQANHADD